jgi:hypothetical protein
VRKGEKGYNDEFEAILGLMTLEELVHLIKELRQSGAVSELLYLKDIRAVCRVRIKELEEPLHLKDMRALCRVRIKELEHSIIELERSAAVSCPGNSESEPSDSESTTGDSQGLHSLRSAACGGGSTRGSGGALELLKRSNDRRGWVRLHAALGADRDTMTHFER